MRRTRPTRTRTEKGKKGDGKGKSKERANSEDKGNFKERDKSQDRKPNDKVAVPAQTATGNTKGKGKDKAKGKGKGKAAAAVAAVAAAQAIPGAVGASWTINHADLAYVSNVAVQSAAPAACDLPLLATSAMVIDSSDEHACPATDNDEKLVNITAVHNVMVENVPTALSLKELSKSCSFDWPIMAEKPSVYHHAADILVRVTMIRETPHLMSSSGVPILVDSGTSRNLCSPSSPGKCVQTKHLGEYQLR